jgi:hypothetical protein
MMSPQKSTKLLKEFLRAAPPRVCLATHTAVNDLPRQAAMAVGGRVPSLPPCAPANALFTNAAVCVVAHGTGGTGGVLWASIHLHTQKGAHMNSIIYIVGLVVIIGFILGYLGLR